MDFDGHSRGKESRVNEENKVVQKKLVALVIPFIIFTLLTLTLDDFIKYLNLWLTLL